MLQRIVLLLLIVNNVAAQTAVEKFENYQNSHHLEKVYINHDKPFYLLGDTIWCQVFFVDAKTHQFFDASPIVHVDLIDSDNSIVGNYLLKIDQGLASFQIPTSYNDKAGEYILRGYTQYQRNFEQDYLFQKNVIVVDDSIAINNADENTKPQEFNAQFFPEGGEIVSGLSNKIALKVQNQNGDNLSYTGVVVDENGNEIKTFISYNEGISFFEFTPQLNKIYSVKIGYDNRERSFELPKALSEGYTINVDSRSQKHLLIKLASNKKQLLGGASIVGQIRGQVFMNEPLKKTGQQKLKLPRDKMPSGILHFTVLDDKGRPVCERIAFNKNPKESIDVMVDLNKEIYSQREKIEFEIRTTHLEKTVLSSYSVSVYNKDVIPVGDNDLNIVNYLLLQSDLKGRISNVNQYFLVDDHRTNFSLDLLMLTHGWSRFTWQDILKEQKPSLEYTTSEDIPFMGIVRKHNNNKPVKADVFLNVLSNTDFSRTKMITEEDGLFYFKGFEFKDTTDILIQANVHNSKKKKKESESNRSGDTKVDIEILELEKLEFDPSVTNSNNILKGVSLVDLANEFAEKKRSDFYYNPEWLINLQEVTVKGSRMTEREKKIENLRDIYKERGIFYFSSSQKIFMDDLPLNGGGYTDIFQVLKGRLPGVQIKGFVPNQYAVLRNASSLNGDIPAIIMVDGFQLADGGGNPIDVQNILAIDVIKGLAATSIFGSAGAGGVISIITKSPEDSTYRGTDKKVKGSINIQSPGFFNAKEFYTPNYEKKEISHQQPNLNTTLYWEPMIQTVEAKNISFFAGDKAGNYFIKIEGITDTGIPFVDFKEFSVGDN